MIYLTYLKETWSRLESQELFWSHHHSSFPCWTKGTHFLWAHPLWTRNLVSERDAMSQYEHQETPLRGALSMCGRLWDILRSSRQICFQRTNLLYLLDLSLSSWQFLRDCLHPIFFLFHIERKLSLIQSVVRQMLLQKTAKRGRQP